MVPMDREVLIRLDGAGKRFSRDVEQQHQALGRELWRLFWGAKPEQPEERSSTFWALNGVSFEVARGQVVGVIGHNGAGKTTLLRLLNGEMVVDAGTVEVVGRRSSLIDLTAGFSHTMTGRENIYYRGAHLGFDRAFLRAKEEEIIGFAELDEFIDAPIKTYSSGMLMRLGFAVTVFAEPDVLLVDEILSVGDFLFQQKCMNKINQLRDRCAIVIVSHAMDTITNFSDRVLLLDRGEPMFIGEPIEAVRAYYELETAKQKQGARLSRAAGRFEVIAVETATEFNFDWSVFGDLPAESGSDASSSDGPSLALVVAERENENDANPTFGVNSRGALQTEALPILARAAMHEFYTNDDALADVEHHWIDAEGRRIDSHAGGAPAVLRISFAALRPIRRLVVGVPIWSSDGVLLTAFGTHGRSIHERINPGRHSIHLHIPALPLNRGVFYPVVAIVDGTEFLYRWPIQPLKIEANAAPLVWGVLTVDYDWSQP